ncbi:PEP-CTERM sorting domain-containing protein [Moorena producens]|uniref:PEP-CTERM sorting domain-containing protein n=1 Tax=Moorena producens TaxID=1155739 RepID=UPI003C7500C3
MISSSPTLVAPITQVDAEEYVFDDLVLGVSRVDLVVLNSQQSSLGFNRIEILEVAFTGSSTATVPEPGSILGVVTVGLGMLFSKFRGGHNSR